jgi:uncharacterized protein (DUF608 family)
VAPGADGSTGGWTATSPSVDSTVDSTVGTGTSQQHGLTWTQGTGAATPTSGDVTLAAVSGSTHTASYATSDDSSVLLSQFAETGALSATVANVAANGAAAVSTTVPAGENATLSIVFAWYFPDRNYAAAGVKGYGEMLGNAYANLWKGSGEVAGELAAPGKLEAVVADITAHHNAVANPTNPTPEWLKDMCVFFSPWRSAPFFFSDFLRYFADVLA